MIHRAKQWLLEARPVETSSVFFILIFFSLTLLFSHAIPSSRLLLVRYVGLLLLIALARWAAESIPKRGWLLLRDFLPALLIFEVYDGLGDMLHLINPHDADPALMRIERFLLGTDPTLWLERLVNPPLNDLMHLAYFSFYFLPFLLGIVLWVKGKREAFNRLVLGVTGAFYLAFIGYVLVPAAGPRYAMAQFYRIPLEGSFITDLVRGFVASAENLRWDCFPSGHAAVTLVVLWYALREEPIVFFPILPVGVLLLVSTVYCRYHYVVDLIAGAAVAALSILSADWLEHLSLRYRERNGLRSPGICPRPMPISIRERE